MTKLEKIESKDYIVSDWSGGKTTQIIIDPPGALYADRDFHFRLSSATVELEESVFTSLPDYERIIAPIEGELKLYYNENEIPVVLHALECDSFDGAWNTRSEGKVIDYNLMTRKGVCCGNSYALIVGAGQSAEICCENTAGARNIWLCWCIQGDANISVEEKSVSLSSFDAARVEIAGEDVALRVKIRGVGNTAVRIMVAQVSFEL